MATSRKKPKIDPITKKVPDSIPMVEIPRDMGEYYWKMIIQLNVLGATITNNLRSYTTSYEQLVEAEDIVDSLMILARKHRYTHPEYRRELEQLDYHLSALSEINEKLALKEWPADSEGNPTRLSMYLETVLWHMPWRSK